MSISEISGMLLNVLNYPHVCIYVFIATICKMSLKFTAIAVNSCQIAVKDNLVSNIANTSIIATVTFHIFVCMFAWVLAQQRARLGHHNDLAIQLLNINNIPIHEA